MSKVEKADKNIKSLKPHVEEAEKQVGRLTKLLDTAKDGSEQQKTLKTLKSEADKDLAEVKARVDEQEVKKSEAHSK